MPAPTVTPPPGSRASVQAQLAAGFKAAGKPALATLVGTPDFNLWLKTESGWRSTAVSPANNQGMVNGGLFQFWYGHPWAQQYFSKGNVATSRFTMPVRDQANAAVKYFNLTPQAVHQYAAQIRAGTYHGWG
jgi:hypothetical protein